MEDFSLIAAALIQHKDAGWIRSITKARETGAAVVLPWNDFTGQPDLLYAFLWYAQECGVMAVVTPQVVHLSMPLVGTDAGEQGESDVMPGFPTSVKPILVRGGLYIFIRRSCICRLPEGHHN